MPGEEAAIPLPKHVHGHAQQTDADLDTGDDDKCAPHAARHPRRDPIIGKVGQDEGEDVLEDEQAGEGFDGDVAVGVDDVERAGDGAHDHADDDEAEEDVRDQPAVSADVGGGDAEAVEADAREDEHGKHEQDAEFRFVFPLVPPDHGSVDPVAQEAREDESNDAADEGARVQVAGAYFVEEEGWAEEDDGDHGPDEYGPADYYALD